MVKRPLDSSEVANLWTIYMSNTAFICFIRYFLAKAEDEETKSILEYALNISKDMINRVEEYFSQENLPVPNGFTADDVDINAPRLYSDTFVLYNYQILSEYGLVVYSLAMTTATREDVRGFFKECIYKTTELFNKVTNVMIEKGIHISSPVISIPNKVDYVHKQSFLAGWFGKQRPLSAIEINDLMFSLKGVMSAKVKVMGLSQVAKSKEVREYCHRGKEIADERIKSLQAILSENDLPTIPTFESEVTNSTIPVFSDKLIMFNILHLGRIAIGRYGTALGSSGRRDLALQYTNLITETGLYIEDGVNIAIKHGWTEQPPLAVDRDELTRI